jgi:GAF domain-containing protein
LRAVLWFLGVRAGVFGAVALGAHRPGRFDATDVEIAVEITVAGRGHRQHRLVDETRRRAEELAALVRTSQLITARLHLASVLDQISRAVSILIRSTGCGSGSSTRSGRTWSTPPPTASRRMPGVPSRCRWERASAAAALRAVWPSGSATSADPRSARRDGRRAGGSRHAVRSPRGRGSDDQGHLGLLLSPGVFTAHHQHLLGAFGEQAGIAIQNAQLFEQSERRGRETRALLEAGRAVTASLDVARTVHVIMHQARSVLGVDSCSIARVEPGSDVLVALASLDLPESLTHQIRIRVGEGIAGLAVQERRPMQSEDLLTDPRVRYPHLARGSGFRSVMAAPLRVGERAIGAISVFRREMRRFSTAEEELLLALADQAAIALEHARLYAEQERVVAERTRELDAQKRFVEVVLEAMPWACSRPGLRVVRHRGAAARSACWTGRLRSRTSSPAQGASLASYLAATFRRPGQRARAG